jgi:glycolate oxidase iron-sulfur subunit
MQTNFTELQLKDPVIAEADAILRRCIHCGLCTATCPTYVLLGDERDSPRGRIYLMKEMFEDGKLTASTARHVDRCLSCLSCMTTCPSGVDYQHLADLARPRIEKSAHRSLPQRSMRYLLAKVLPYPRRFRVVLVLGWLLRPFRGLFEKIGLHRLAASLALVPARPPRIKLRKRKALIRTTEPTKVKRVALMLGCVQEVLNPAINRAAIRLLKRHGVDVILGEEEMCCGGLVQSMGREDDAAATARRNVDAWSAALRDARLDAILVTASGCGSMVKDYGHLLARDRGYGARAAEISNLARDITEFMEEIGLTTPIMWTSLKVAYHAACSLEHGQRVVTAPRLLLEQAGFSVVEIPEGHICCGSAGTYNLLQPELAGELRARKLANIASIAPDVIATGNIGCMTQLAGAGIPIVHTIELLDWATGGPCPKPLEGLQSKAHPVKALMELANLST